MNKIMILLGVVLAIAYASASSACRAQYGECKVHLISSCDGGYWQDGLCGFGKKCCIKMRTTTRKYEVCHTQGGRCQSVFGSCNGGYWRDGLCMTPLQKCCIPHGSGSTTRYPKYPKRSMDLCEKHLGGKCNWTWSTCKNGKKYDGYCKLPLRKCCVN